MEKGAWEGSVRLGADLLARFWLEKEGGLCLLTGPIIIGYSRLYYGVLIRAPGARW